MQAIEIETNITTDGHIHLPDPLRRSLWPPRPVDSVVRRNINRQRDHCYWQTPRIARGISGRR